MKLPATATAFPFHCVPACVAGELRLLLVRGRLWEGTCDALAAAEQPGVSKVLGFRVRRYLGSTSSSAGSSLRTSTVPSASITQPAVLFDASSLPADMEYLPSAAVATATAAAAAEEAGEGLDIVGGAGGVNELQQEQQVLALAGMCPVSIAGSMAAGAAAAGVSVGAEPAAGEQPVLGHMAQPELGMIRWVTQGRMYCQLGSLYIMGSSLVATDKCNTWAPAYRLLTDCSAGLLAALVCLRPASIAVAVLCSFAYPYCVCVDCRYGGKLYGFSSLAALAAFVSGPESTLDALRQAAHNAPLLLHALGLSSGPAAAAPGARPNSSASATATGNVSVGGASSYPGSNSSSPVNGVSGAGSAAGYRGSSAGARRSSGGGVVRWRMPPLRGLLELFAAPLKVEAGTQTVTHPVERFIDIDYEWNEWALRRRVSRGMPLADTGLPVTTRRGSICTRLAGARQAVALRKRCTQAGSDPASTFLGVTLACADLLL